MNLNRSNVVTLALALVALFALPTHIRGQSVAVKRINAETAEGLLISIWIENQTVGFGQDITIYYKVENRSAQTVYLISQDTPDIVAERATIRIGAPVPLADSHGGYDYNFTKIERGRAHQGRLTVSSDKYGQARPWFVEIGFAYVTDITGLNRRLRPNEDPVALRGALSLRALTLLLGRLTVDVIK